MENFNKKNLFIAQAAIIAAIYVTITMIFAPISFGHVQVRISEALTILPVFTPAAIPGLFVGAFLANTLGPGGPIDMIFGSLATLIAAVLTYWIRRYNEFLAPIPPIIVNALIIPFVIYYGFYYGTEHAFTIPFFMLTVGAGQIIACGILGTLLYLALRRHRKTIFRNEL